MIHQIDPKADLTAKRSNAIDSWFIIAKVLANDGHEFFFMSHAMRVSSKIPFRPGITIAVNSITDASIGNYISKEYEYSKNQIHFSYERFLVDMPDFRLSGSIEDMDLTANVPDGTIQVHLKHTGPVLYNRGSGRYEMLSLKTCQYALPKMETTGFLTFKGKKYEVEGFSWFDRQWAPKLPLSLIIKRNYKWIWMNLCMDNGDFISLWEIVDLKKGIEYSGGTVLQSDGVQREVAIEPMEQNVYEYWRSPVTGQRYPTFFVVKIPSMDTNIQIKPVIHEQEIQSHFDNKYEGACTFKGIYKGEKVGGWTYVEMVGKWK